MCGLSCQVTKAASEINELTDDAGAAASLGYGIGRSRGVPRIGAWIILPNLVSIRTKDIEETTDNVDLSVAAVVSNSREETRLGHWRACGPGVRSDIVDVSRVEAVEVGIQAAKNIYLVGVTRVRRARIEQRLRQRRQCGPRIGYRIITVKTTRWKASGTDNAARAIGVCAIGAHSG